MRVVMPGDRRRGGEAADALANLLALSVASPSPVDPTRHAEWLASSKPGQGPPNSKKARARTAPLGGERTLAMDDAILDQEVGVAGPSDAASGGVCGRLRRSFM